MGRRPLYGKSAPPLLYVALSLDEHMRFGRCHSSHAAGPLASSTALTPFGPHYSYAFGAVIRIAVYITSCIVTSCFALFEFCELNPFQPLLEGEQANWYKSLGLGIRAGIRIEIRIGDRTGAPAPETESSLKICQR